jgi:hypothetical protein
VALLRRVLYLQAAVWAGAGIALLVTGPSWARLAGVQGFGLAMFMVLVAHRAEDLWWWSWGFALATVATAAVVLLHAAFGLPAGRPSWPWWLFALIAGGFALGQLFGLYLTSRERAPL